MSNHIIAKLLSQQVSTLALGSKASISFLLHSPKKWQRGRFERLKVTFMSVDDLIEVHLDHTDVDGKPISTLTYMTEPGTHQHLAEYINDKKIFDIDCGGLEVTK